VARHHFGWSKLQEVAVRPRLCDRSINAHLSTVKVYAKLAARQSPSAEEYARIRMVSGYRHKKAGMSTRTRGDTKEGAKKSEAVAISQEQAKGLKSQPDTHKGDGMPC